MISRKVHPFFELRDLSSEFVIVVPGHNPGAPTNNNNMEAKLAFFLIDLYSMYSSYELNILSTFSFRN